MKKMKKLVGILLTLAMVVAMSITTFAEENSGYTISTKEDDNHTYEVYQIFTGDWDGTTKVLSNVKWGQNGKNGDMNVNEGSKVDESILSNLAGVNSKSDTEKLAVIKTYADLDSNKKFGEVTKDNPLPNVPVGYYLIKDKDGSQTGENSSYTLYLVNVVNDNVEITRKADKPTSEKKVKDVNDSSNTDEDNHNYKDKWIDSADYDIGDDVPFQLKGTVISERYADYKTYKFVFHDKQSAGLTFKKETVKVYVDGKELRTGYEVKTDGLEDGDTFEVIFEDLKKIEAVHAGSVITVEYKSELNSNAIIGSEGNPNEMYLEYSNNPNTDKGNETGKTPDDKVIVFTYLLEVNKVNENQDPLTGAEFTLEKKVGPDEENWKAIDVIKNEAGTLFTFKGLDEGTYRLTETVTPSGYNTIEPLVFTVTANHDITSDAPELKGITGNATTGVIEFTLATLKDEKGKDTDKLAGLATTVENKKGTTLPSTGGMGTTILYVVGAILVIGAGILLVTKKRMNANK